MIKHLLVFFAVFNECAEYVGVGFGDIAHPCFVNCGKAVGFFAFLYKKVLNVLGITGWQYKV